MSAKPTETGAQIAATMRGLGQRARSAARALARSTGADRGRALAAAAAAIRARSAEIVAANAKDMESARARNLSKALLDRLLLDEKRVEAMARSIDEVIALPDPVGQVMAEWARPNGLVMTGERVLLGMDGIIVGGGTNVTGGTWRDRMSA